MYISVYTDCHFCGLPQTAPSQLRGNKYEKLSLILVFKVNTHNWGYKKVSICEENCFGNFY